MCKHRGGFPDYETPTPEFNRSIHRPDDGALSVRLRRSAPTFPPPVWNVNTETLADGDRTNNLAETWNKAFAVVVGHSHPSVLRHGRGLSGRPGVG